MEKLTFAVEITKALAWPAVVAGGAAYFRDEIKLLLSTAVNTFDRMRKVSYGGIEITSEVAVATIATAAAASDDKAEEMKNRITNEQLSPDDRAKLLEDLKAATLETQRLQAILASLNTAQASSELEQNKYSMDVKKIGLRAIVTGITAEKILYLFDSGKIDELSLIIDRFLEEATMPGNNTPGISRALIKIMASVGTLAPDGKVTPIGLRRITDRARRMSLG